MDRSAMLCLHIPVAISLGQCELRGELALPRGAKELRVCIARETDRSAQQREARRCAEQEIAALNLQSATTMTSGDLLRVIDWVRSRRLLRPLPILLVLPTSDTRAALKAAHHRPASVARVLVLKSVPPAQPVRLRHLTLAYSA